ncbi:MAG: pentapeptide repeat-containing protein [Phycisphaerae bacterium]|nr:pentapeptide repeat-containing protein [Phycisphaerae bacterium]MDD5381096.1 pentapeptide repeat-containing protein [Phycisphaerae bacterium]
MSEEGKKGEEKKWIEEELRFSKEQYDFLKKCSEEGAEGIKKWNEWRKEHPKEEIWLQNADFTRAYLENTKLRGVNLQDADLWRVDLQGARLWDTKLQDASLRGASLQGAVFGGAELQGADFSHAIVDGETLIWECKVDRLTDFRGVGLDSVRIDAATKQLLEYNIRRMNWEEWYGEHWLLRWPVQAFWAMSDYGMSTLRVMGVFLILALLFAAVYRLWPNFVMVNGVVGDIRGFWHVLYFSVVTMTTLGFGDIAANPDSWWGQTLLMAQVILGYVLLGTLITRFAVLFTAGGPAGKFAKGEKK